MTLNLSVTKLPLKHALNDENIDGILIIFTQQAVSESVEIAKNIVELVRNKTYQNKTILTSFMGFGAVQEANTILNANNIPTYTTPEQAIKTYMYMYNTNATLNFYTKPLKSCQLMRHHQNAQ